MMRKNIYLFLSIVQLGCASTIFAEDQDVISITSESFLFQTEKISENEIGGLAGKIVTESLKKKNMKYKLLWRPWKRAQKETLSGLDGPMFIIPLTRNKERELRYNWVAHLYNNDTAFFTLKGKPIIKDLKGAKNKVIGVLNGSSYEITLKEAQLEYEVSTLDESNAKKLILKKIDAWYTDKITGFTAFKINNVNPNQVVIGRSIDSEKIYIATGKNTPQKLVDKVRGAIEDFKKTARYKSLIEDAFEKEF